ncbi:MAG: hypothetical protein GXY92_03705 [Syntrophomonadaceae bacterium]|nr:hypothetical protein [Syntrophomonadaceae bacterium]
MEKVVIYICNLLPYQLELSFFANEPGRCPACRAARKAESRGNRSGYERTERQMFPAVCSACGKDTTVPFQLKRERPIYCRDCYSSQPRRN